MRDIELKNRIKMIFIQLTEQDKTDKEIIEGVAGLCGISFRTASEHFRAWKAQKSLQDLGFKVECPHEWSNWFSTPTGLVRECRLCFKTEEKNAK